MWKSISIMFFISIFILANLTSCTSEQEMLSIEDAKKAGFERDKQQMFQMVSAQDGWSGNWVGDRVELYEYKDIETANEHMPQFESMINGENISGWEELCTEKNMVMLSKGENACDKLRNMND